MPRQRASPARQDVKRRRPFRTPAQEVFVGLLRTADVVRQRAAADLASSGLTPQQYNVLWILRSAGEEGIPTLEIGERMIERAPGVTRLLDRLQKKGLVRRRRSPEDRRQVLCWPTPRALRLLAELDRPIAESDREAIRALGRREIDTLIDLLDRVRSGGGRQPVGSRRTRRPPARGQAS
jgi:MarR family transcriptional regulator, organic hydroperoxide resistance regulator